MCLILVVDDDATVRGLMATFAERLGHEVRQACTADEAIEQMAAQSCDVVICDVAMPGRDGLWLAGQLRRAYPETAVIMATGRQAADVALSSLRHGAVDFLAKPFDHEAFRNALARGVRWHRNARQTRERLDALQREVHDRLRHLESFFAVTQVASDADLERMIETVMPDRASAEHAQRVVALATNMALSMGLRSPELDDIARAALLHDLGRVALPPAILCKPVRLSDEEIAIVRQQPRLVADILDRNTLLAPAAVMVRAIFEHFDGSGHPWALRGSEIPRGSRVIAVADAFDTMTHYRVHQAARAPAEALFEVERCRGTQFDPAAVDALLQVVHLHWTPAARRITDDDPCGGGTGAEASGDGGSSLPARAAGMVSG